MGGCDNCIYFIKIKSFMFGVGICDYDDGKLGSVVKSCPKHKALKYKRSLNNRIKRWLNY